MIPDKIIHTTFLKPSGAVTNENKITLVQRQLWNILYAHAMDELTTKKVHEMPLRLIFAEKDFDLKEYSELKIHLKALVETTVEWNLLQKDKRVWGIAAYLASAEINEATGMLEYEYSEKILNKLIIPKYHESIKHTPYAKLSLVTQRNFRSKHTQFWYEFLTDLYFAYQEETVTKWIHLDELQAMMGTSYQRWTDIKDKLLKKPINELAEHIPFTVIYQTMKAIRKTTHVRFRLRSKTAPTSKKIKHD